MKKSAEKDEQLELKKRARRRLVGAVVFVSAAAVVLPLVMDEEPPRLPGGIELHIPAQEKGYTPPAVALAAPEPMPAGEAAKPVAGEPVAAPVPVPVVEDAKPDAQADAADKGEAKPGTASKAPGAKAAARKPVAAGDAARAQAILEGRADKLAAKNAQYIVLIGAFANPANVQVLQKKLGEMGIRVYTEALDTPQGRKTRVRAGPFATHEAAEKAAARMKKIGVGGVVAVKS